MNEKLQKIWAKCALTLSRQSSRSASTCAVAGLAAVLALPAAAGPVDWAHQNGSVQSNGAVTVKSLSGGSYSATGNPSGAVAKANQNAATQPPTVIIQATSSNLPFNFKDDCYFFLPPMGLGYAQQTMYRVGLGKIDATGNFTGIASGNQYSVATLIGTSTGSSANGSAVSGGIPTTTPSTFWANSDPAGNPYIAVGIAIPVRTPAKCYP